MKSIVNKILGIIAVASTAMTSQAQDIHFSRVEDMATIYNQSLKTTKDIRLQAVNRDVQFNSASTYKTQVAIGDFALLNFGKRDVGIDVDNPNPVRVGHDGAINACIPKLNDQHAYLVGKLDPSVSLGDWVACGISHPCTTFDKWRIFPVIDDNDKVVDYIRTYF